MTELLLSTAAAGPHAVIWSVIVFLQPVMWLAILLFFLPEMHLLCLGFHTVALSISYQPFPLYLHFTYQSHPMHEAGLFDWTGVKLLVTFTICRQDLIEALAHETLRGD